MDRGDAAAIRVPPAIADKDRRDYPAAARGLRRPLFGRVRALPARRTTCFRRKTVPVAARVWSLCAIAWRKQTSLHVTTYASRTRHAIAHSGLNSHRPRQRDFLLVSAGSFLLGRRRMPLG